MLTQVRLKDILTYDQDTGEFFWNSGSYQNHVDGSLVGWREKSGYLRVMIDGKRYLLHRLAFLYVNGCFPEEQVDHRNRIKNDNRWCNLREADSHLNACNRSSNNEIIGLSRQHNAYRVIIKGKHIGRFKGLVESVLAKHCFIEGEGNWRNLIQRNTNSISMQT